MPTENVILFDKNPPGSIVIVDPGGSSGYWYRSIRRRFLNTKIVVVWSSSTIMEANQWKIIHNETSDYEYLDDNKLIDNLKGHEPIHAIFACGDTGISVVDQLRMVFTPSKCNDAATATVRTDKYSLYQHLKKTNLIKTNQWLIDKNNLDQGSILWDQIYIIKPLHGSGGENFATITNENELIQYLNKPSFHRWFILQEKVYGTEFSIDMVSQAGRHHLFAIWKYTKNTNSHVKDEVDLIRLPSEGHKVTNLIVDYVRKILDSIGLKFGPSHTEVMVTKDGDINLIEVNLRLHGHLDEDIQRRIFITSQPELALLATNDNIHLSGTNYSFLTKANLKKIFCNNKIEQYIEKINWEDISKLANSNWCRIYKSNYLIPNVVKPTSCVQNCLGVIMLIQTSNDDLWHKEIAALRIWKEQLTNNSFI